MTSVPHTTLAGTAPGNRFSIRDCHLADADLVAAINSDTRADGFSESGFIILELTAEDVRAEIASRSASYLICTVRGQAVAFLKYSRRSLDEYGNTEWFGAPVDLASGTHIEKVVVRRDCRGAGIGRALYAALADRVDEHVRYTFVVVSPCPNEASLGFHRALGFRPVGRACYELPDGSWFRESLLLDEYAAARR